MANRFIPYPLSITKTANGYTVKTTASDTGPEYTYVFANMSDLTYWLSLNEQPLP